MANLSRFRIRPRRYFLLCPAAGEADCHVAALLAMTCCNMHLPAWQGRFPSGKFVALFRIPQASPPLQPHPHPRLLPATANHRQSGYQKPPGLPSPEDRPGGLLYRLKILKISSMSSTSSVGFGRCPAAVKAPGLPPAVLAAGDSFSEGLASKPVAMTVTRISSSKSLE